MVGLELSPFYRDSGSGEISVLLLRGLHRELSRALQKSFFDFTQVQAAQSAQLRAQSAQRRAPNKAKACGTPVRRPCSGLCAVRSELCALRQPSRGGQAGESGDQ
jgi:hypothetical protein